MKTKYPKTPHLPFSQSVNNDDVIISNFDRFIGKEVIVTEKLDGENTTLTSEKWHSRSLNSSYHPSRRELINFYEKIKSEIPENWKICGENCYAYHSIFYEMTYPWFFVFSIWNELDVCISWNETVEVCKMLNIPTVPVLYKGMWNEDMIKSCWTGKSKYGKEQEGYVVRLDSFHIRDFDVSVAKFVRSNHVQTDKFWRNYSVIVNQYGNEEKARERIK